MSDGISTTFKRQKRRSGTVPWGEEHFDQASRKPDNCLKRLWPEASPPGTQPWGGLIGADNPTRTSGHAQDTDPDAERRFGTSFSRGLKCNASHTQETLGAGDIIHRVGVGGAKCLGVAVGARSFNVGQQVGQAAENRLDQGVKPEGSSNPKSAKTKNGNVVLFQRCSRKKTSAPVRVADVRSTVEGIKAVWRNAPGIVIADNFDALLTPIWEQARKDGADQAKIVAAGHRGSVYLVGEHPRLTTQRGIEEAMLHEAWGHYGLRALFGKDTCAASVPLLGYGIPGLRYLDGNSCDLRVARVQSMLPSMADPINSPTYKRWLGDWNDTAASVVSTVANAVGRSLWVNHGIAEGFHTFEEAKLGTSVGQMLAPLRHFLATAKAESFVCADKEKALGCQVSSAAELNIRGELGKPRPEVRKVLGNEGLRKCQARRRSNFSLPEASINMAAVVLKKPSELAFQRAKGWQASEKTSTGQRQRGAQQAAQAVRDRGRQSPASIASRRQGDVPVLSACNDF